MKVRALQRLIFLLLLPALLFGPASFGIKTHVADAQTISTDADDETVIQDAIRTGRPITVIVELADPPLASYTGGIRNIGPTKPAKGKKLDPESTDAIGYSRYLEEQRAKFKAVLRNISGTAKIEAEYNAVLNGLALTLSGYDLERLLSVPGISVSLVREYRPLLNRSRGLTGAPTAGPLGTAGAGIKIGIIDSGIDQAHAFLTPPIGFGPPLGFPKGDSTCTSGKVIVARSYPTPPGPRNCADTIGHGTHVAGIAAGFPQTSVLVKGVTVADLSGIAPRAWLGNYNVFPNKQGTARSVEIIRAVEDAVKDHMDVINMSLGRPVHKPEAGDPLARAVDKATDAGVVVVVAAGNSGPGFFTIESPGNASGAITVGASSNPHFLRTPVVIGGTVTIGAAVGDFGNFFAAVSGDLANWNHTDPSGATTQACSPTNAGTYTNQIVIIDRGGCTFTTKVRNAKDSGAAAALIVNNVAGDPTAMGQDGTGPVAISAAMVGLADRVTLRSNAGNSAIVGGGLPAEFVSSGNLSPDGATANADIMAGFSSRGPVRFDITLKPDLTGPGINVLSSTLSGDWIFLDGTSMSTPHVAGGAALLRQLHPDWTPEQIKSALVTLAKPHVWSHVDGTTEVDARSRGGGRVNLEASVGARVTFSPADFSFGQIPPKNKAQLANEKIKIINVKNLSLSWNVDNIPDCTVNGTTVATFTVLPNNGSLNASGTSGDTKTFTVKATTQPNAPETICTGDVVVHVTGQTQPYHLPWILVHLKNTP